MTEVFSGQLSTAAAMFSEGRRWPPHRAKLRLRQICSYLWPKLKARAMTPHQQPHQYEGEQKNEGHDHPVQIEELPIVSLRLFPQRLPTFRECHAIFSH